MGYYYFLATNISLAGNISCGVRHSYFLCHVYIYRLLIADVSGYFNMKQPCVGGGA
jgi:hypothetical protein